jgi:hypothetical protein
MKKIIRQILAYLKKVLWSTPTDKDKATDVIQNYTCINYKGQWVNLHKNQVAAFNALSRYDKRAMAKRFEVLVRKGKLKFVEINGVMTCVKNKDYERKADTRQ